MKLEMGKAWVEEQNRRMLRMQSLYVLDGRHHSDHEFHGLYTGLAAKAEELEAELNESSICDI
tara:strand:- start:550 stop:738 length:189 start_codon:yes stop_codon:yes gene_type:complete